MRVDAVDDVEAFATAAGALLAADEANHTVLLAALQGAQHAQANAEPLPDGWSAAIVCDGTRVVAAARLWRGTWSLSSGPAEALHALGAWAAARGRFAGATGPDRAVQAFEAGAALPMRTLFELPLLRLDGRPALPRPVTGSLRPAEPADLPVLLAWHEAFRTETRIAQSAAQVAADTERAVRLGNRYLWVDEAGSPLGMVGGRCIAPTGARIGPVFTPPAQRGRGIGDAMVAAFAQRLREAGARCVFLFTDAANPVSNALYRRIGFAPVGRHLHRVVATAPED